MAGFEPAVSCARGTRNTRLSYVLHEKRPAGVEPALPPWQGGRLPLHHGRANVCRIVKEPLRSTGRDLNPRRRITGAVSSPLDDQCLSVGPDGLEPSPAWLRARYAAANTLIPCIAGQSARKESNPRPGPYKRPALTTELRAVSGADHRCATVPGLEPLLAGLKVRCAAVTPRPRNVGRAYPFQSHLVHVFAPRFQW